MPNEKRDWIEVGVAWKKDGAKGLAFSVDPDKLREWAKAAEANDKGKLALFMFRNEDKKSDRAPDYRLVGPVPQGSAPKDEPRGKSSYKADDDESDLPF